MASRRLLLVNPGALFAADWAGRHPLKGALVELHAFLRAHDVAVGVLDLQTELGNPEPGQVDEFVRRGRERLDAHNFDVLGISCWTSLEYLGALEFAAHVRATRPGVPIVVGGYHPTARPGDFAAAGLPFDVVVRGEGELTLLELLREETLRAGDGTARIVDGAPLPMDRPWFDLDEYPYLGPRPLNVGVYLSRGCPYRCTFCMEASTGRRGWRRLSVEHALEVVRKVQSYDPGVIVFFDACFGYQAAWRREFLQGLVDLRMDVPYWAEMRADRLGASDLDAFEKLDLYATFGVETMSPRMAEIMRKAPDGAAYVRTVDEILREVNRRRILNKAFLLLNHPGETAETAEETVDYFERFVAEHDALTVIPNANRYKFFAGADTDLRRAHYERAYGTRFSHLEWYKERAPQLPLAEAHQASAGFTDVAAYEARLDALHPRIVRKMPAEQQLLFLRNLKRLG